MRLAALRCTETCALMRYGFDAPCFTRLTLRAPSASFGLSALTELAFMVKFKSTLSTSIKKAPLRGHFY